MKCSVRLDGTKPLIMHQDNIPWAEKVKAWTEDPENKKKSVAGDDRSPTFTWLGGLYHDGKHVTLPSDNFMTMIREGGTQVLVPGAKGGKTFKSQTQSGVIPLDCDMPLFGADGKVIPVSEILALEHVEDFEEHLRVVHEHGFDLLVKRAKIGTKKHIRVRPIFRAWSVVGEFEITDDQITIDVLRTILTIAGKLKGLGDWRPSSKTPGGFGTFSADVKVVK